MLRVQIDLVSALNGSVHALGGCTISNMSDLADISDYRVIASEEANWLVPRTKWHSVGIVGRHDRRQSVWALVARAAFWAAQEAEKK